MKAIKIIVGLSFIILGGYLYMYHDSLIGIALLAPIGGSIIASALLKKNEIE